MSAPAAVASSTAPAVGYTLCPHTCGCRSFKCSGNTKVNGRMSFKCLAIHLKGKNAHPLCCITCPQFMSCDESDSVLDEWGDGASGKRKATDDGPPPLVPVASQSSVPVRAPIPSPKKARLSPEPAATTGASPYMPAAEFRVAASSANGLYMTSSQYAAAILAKVEDHVATLRVRFGKAQVEALQEMRENEIKVDCAGISKTAIDRFGDEIKKAGFDGLRCVQAEDMLYVAGV